MTDKILIDRELLFKTEQLLDDLRGDVNPERGYAEEFEMEILITQDQLRAALAEAVILAACEQFDAKGGSGV